MYLYLQVPVGNTCTTVCRNTEEDALRVAKTRQKDHSVKLKNKNKLYWYVCTCCTCTVCMYKSTCEEVQG